MVASPPILLAALYLLAAAPGNKGRERFAPKRKRKRQNRQQRTTSPKENALPPPPPPTDPNGPFPTYFTCRHSYEDTLMEEMLLQDSSLTVSTPYPGLVRVENDHINDNNDNVRDPVYALQALHHCRIVHIPNSIKGLAKAIAEVPTFQTMLQEAPKGSLVIHALVPGMCKGQREPKLQRRANLVTNALLELLKKRFPAARKSQNKSEHDAPLQPLLLQVMLLSPNVAAASLTKCRPLNNNNNNNNNTDMLWPNPHLPLGLAKVDIDVKMPSSAYRKLLEALACLGNMPSQNSVVVDLGASPGGWTYAVLLHCQPRQIIAVDRAQLDPTLLLMNKNPTMIDFVQGDAFSYRPPHYSVDWMISDVIAYPERIVNLLDTWCCDVLAKQMVVTLKFQGDSPSWHALQQALDVAQSHGYHARAKHFFNNKNEVTLMLQYKDANNNNNDATTMSIREPIYKRAWPKGG